MVTLSALISGLDRELLHLGYKESTMIWYRQCWRRLAGYFSDRGVEAFSLIAMAWVDTACDFFAKEQTGTLKQTDVYLFWVAQMLGDFVVHGAVLHRYDRRADKLTADQVRLIGTFQAGLRAEGCAVATVRTYGTLAGEFLSFVDTRARLADCDARTIEAFVATLSGYQAKTVEQKLCAVRAFLRYAGRQGQVNADVLKAVPPVKPSKHARVPSVWDAADVARILDAIDRGNPCGKRDYAIITLVTRLGLRSIDVKRLELDDLD
ncbi:site-specific integrase [Kosakonia sp. S42]|uniref:tyrosine-type recombinase/integrase n=1 Tax=Kosakonia sp. S42 TaxID=2767458 RepID=UPI001F223FDC|nr:site-specific integrase [Kosakonia sp. S42]